MKSPSLWIITILQSHCPRPPPLTAQPAYRAWQPVWTWSAFPRTHQQCPTGFLLPSRWHQMTSFPQFPTEYLILVTNQFRLQQSPVWPCKPPLQLWWNVFFKHLIRNLTCGTRHALTSWEDQHPDSISELYSHCPHSLSQLGVVSSVRCTYL